MTDQEIRLKFGEMNAGEMRLARALVAWHEREIAKIKAAMAESEIVSLLDECDKAQGILKACLSVMPFGNIETHTFENLPGRIADLASEIASLSLENERLETELAALRQPILADDGRSLGQVAMKASFQADEEGLTVDECYEAAAQAVVAAARPVIEAECLAQAQQAAAQPWTPAVGDVVRLKSGGPVMTVTHVDPLSLMCAWMNADDELQVEPITTLCLTPVPAP